MTENSKLKSFLFTFVNEYICYVFENSSKLKKYKKKTFSINEKCQISVNANIPEDSELVRISVTAQLQNKIIFTKEITLTSWILQSTYSKEILAHTFTSKIVDELMIDLKKYNFASVLSPPSELEPYYKVSKVVDDFEWDNLSLGHSMHTAIDEVQKLNDMFALPLTSVAAKLKFEQPIQVMGDISSYMPPPDFKTLENLSVEEIKKLIAKTKKEASNLQELALESEKDKVDIPMKSDKQYKGEDTVIVEYTPLEEKIPTLSVGNNFALTEKLILEKSQEFQLEHFATFSEAFAYRLKTDPSVKKIELPQHLFPIHICSHCLKQFPKEYNGPVKRCLTCFAKENGKHDWILESIDKTPDKYLLYDQCFTVNIKALGTKMFGSLPNTIGENSAKASLETFVYLIFGDKLPPVKTVTVEEFNCTNYHSGDSKMTMEIAFEVESGPSIFHIQFIYGKYYNA